MTASFALLVCVVLFAGWRLRDLRLISPASGIGYLFGIVGTALMLVLLLYSVRKRFPQVERVGSIKLWFQSHMLLGILGPLLILFHTNFHLGALNSNVALFSMFIVVSSGIIGRYLYRKIHHGLYGHRTTLIELRSELEREREDVGPLFAMIPSLKEELFAFADEALAPSTTIPQSLKRALAIGWRARVVGWHKRRVARAYLAQHAAQNNWTATQKRKMLSQTHREIRRFLAQTVRVARFNLYERVFALWHLLHIPLVVMVVITATIHVIAVRRY